MKPRKPILPYKVGKCSICGYKDKKLISGKCFEQPNFCYQSHQKQKYLDKQPNTKPQKPIKKVSDKRKKENIIYEAEKKKHFIEYPTCQFPGCNSENRTLHHACGRIGSLLYDRRFFKTLCPDHHIFCEENPIKAKELGLSLDRL